MREIIFFSIIAFSAVLLLLFELEMSKVKRRTQIKVCIHNRAVRLGLYANNESINSREDCFVCDSFLTLHNDGTVDVAYLQNCAYKNLIKYTAEDLFLGE